jgi:hypothetical protein
MFGLMKDDQEAKAARIDEATRDWLESQVFPTIPLVSERNALRCLGVFVSPVKEPVDIGSIFLGLPQAA